MKKKIIFLTSSLNRGGAERQLIYLLEKISKINKYNITLVSFNNTKNGYKLKKFKKKIKIIYLHVNKAKFINSLKYVKILFTIYKLITVLKKEKPNIAISYLLYINVITQLSILFSRLYIYHIWSIRNSSLGLNNYLKKKIFMIFASILSLKADYFFFNSKKGYYVYRKILNLKKYRIIHNFIPIKDFTIKKKNPLSKNLIKSRKIIIGRIGNFYPVKNYEILIKSISILKKKRINVECRIYGNVSDDTYYKKIIKMIKNLNLLSNIKIFKNKVINEHVYSKFDINIVNSLNEGMSNVLIESMLCGIKTLYSDCGDNIKLFGKKYLIQNNISPKYLADKIIKLHKEKINKNIIRSKVLDKFNNKKNFNKIIEIIE